MTARKSLDEIIAHALDAYGAEMAKHSHEWDARRYGAIHTAICTCGFERTGRAPARAVGLHIAAAHKRASKACDVEMKRLMDQADAEYRAEYRAATAAR